jgi:hypothetical protein
VHDVNEFAPETPRHPLVLRPMTSSEPTRSPCTCSTWVLHMAEWKRQIGASKPLIRNGFWEGGGGGGIRTRDTVSRMHAFQACALNHSATPPEAAHPSEAVMSAQHARRSKSAGGKSGGNWVAGRGYSAASATAGRSSACQRRETSFSLSRASRSSSPRAARP